MSTFEALWSDGVVERWTADDDDHARADVALWESAPASARNGAHVSYLERLTDDGGRQLVAL